MKHYRLLMSLLLIVTVTCGQVMGADVAVTLDNIGASIGSTANTSTATTDITATGTTDSYSINYYQCKKQGNAMLMTKSVSAYISNKTAMPGNIKSVEVFINSGASGKTTYDCAFDTKEIKSATKGIGAVNITGGNSHTYSNLTSGGTINVEGKYFCITLGNANNGQVLKLVITCEGTSGSSPEPTVLAEPKTIDFGTVDQNATIESKTVAVTYENLTGSVTYSGLSNPFNATGIISKTGDKITITPNTATIGNYSQTLTIQSSSDNESAEVVVTMNVVKPFNGKKLTFDVSSNPGEWPTTNSTETKNYTYTLDEINYTFALNNVKSNSGYLMLTSTAKLGLPAISGYKLVKIEATNSSGCSTSTKVKIASDENGNIIVGDEQTWSQQSSTYTYTLSNTEENTMYYLIATNKNCQIVSLNLYYEKAETPSVAKPIITGETPFATTTNVTLNCATEGAEIYYTTNGSDPKSGTKYTTPFTLNNSATIKAIAKFNETWSSIVEKEFEKVISYSTLADIYAKAVEVNDIATDVYVTFEGWKISGVSGKNAFLTDGTNGLVIFGNNGSGFSAGDELTGTVICKLQLYNGFAEITSLTKTTDGLSVISGDVGAPLVKTWGQLSAINTGALVTLENLTYDGTSLTDGENTIPTYTTFYTADFANGKKYNVTGIYQYYKTNGQLLPRSAADIEEIVIEGAPEAPTFTPEAGTYTSVQNVTISCATQGASIYYTTDGTTPTENSTAYSSAISVDKNMTIKAIAIKNDKSSTIASAAYVINLPEDENTSKTWDLSKDQTTTASENELTWTSTYIDMSVSKSNSTTNANNYYPGTSGKSYTSTRFYQNSTLTITPKEGKKITAIFFKAATETYASTFVNCTWSNATAEILDPTYYKDIVKITPNHVGNVSAVIGGTCGFLKVQIVYEDAPDVATTGVSLDQDAITLKEGKTATLIAELTPIDAKNQNVTWSSDNEAVATVENGVVTAVSIGNATITVTTEDGGFIATCTVTVIDPSTRFGDLAVFKKVTNTAEITDGEYLIVYEGENEAVAFDGGLETLDAAGNTMDVVIENDTIIAYDDAVFTIDVTAGTIKSYSGKYVGRTANSNGMDVSTSSLTNTIEIEDGTVVITSSGNPTLRFNKDNGQKRFRYYKSGQQAIQLYKKQNPVTLRETTTGSWGTLCPQKKILVPSGASFYTLTYKEVHDGVPYKVFFDEIGEGESLEAGKPYLFMADGDAIKGVETGSAANASHGYNGFYGNVADTLLILNVNAADQDAYRYYIIYQGEIRLCGTGSYTIGTGRAYINMSELSDKYVAAAPGRRRVSMSNPQAPQVATGIDATTSNGKAVKVMINEQLFILRDGKLYDTTGRIVK